ncbi:MarR family transcriptional regulator [Streptomyces sp. NBC_01808]|uniref:MarR family transcriptional regulator n=1 Tax=Streptomyces sp. NBC_01808 TaxID=2975947 RepID=UPI002DDB84E2|nr:MarR family transcriptional regulator [Streptomyces sp. NBC_01808]WSA42274.1 MarR family transcriptional regulator [Streptomyces sp. NBC_01808]
MQEKLTGRLSRRAQADSGMPASDYTMLAKPTETSSGTIRSTDLTNLVEREKNRMSHQVARMTKRGLMTKKDRPAHGRGAFIATTPARYKATEEATPPHAEHARRPFIDALTSEDLGALTRTSNRVLTHIEAAQLTD